MNLKHAILIFHKISSKWIHFRKISIVCNSIKLLASHNLELICMIRAFQNKINILILQINNHKTHFIFILCKTKVLQNFKFKVKFERSFNCAFFSFNYRDTVKLMRNYFFLIFLFNCFNKLLLIIINWFIWQYSNCWIFQH